MVSFVFGKIGLYKQARSGCCLPNSPLIDRNKNYFLYIIYYNLIPFNPKMVFKNKQNSSREISGLLTINRL